MAGAAVAAKRYESKAARLSAVSFVRGAMSSTTLAHSAGERLFTGSGVWHEAHGPAKIRRPSFNISGDAPREALTIAGVTGGATFPPDAQPDAARTVSARIAKSAREPGRMDGRAG
jgi:hypothetical protein